MSMTYEKLSRRALIELGHDYDSASGGELQDYLTAHEDEYEKIRPIETVVQCTDRFVETISRSAISVKGNVNDAANGAIEKVTDMALNNADKLVCAAGAAIVSKLTF